MPFDLPGRRPCPLRRESWRAWLRTVSTLALVALLLGSNAPLAAGAAPRAASDSVPEEVVVRLGQGQSIQALASRHRLEVLDGLPEANTYLVRPRDRAESTRTARLLEGDAAVDFAEPNVVLRIPMAQVGLPGIDQVGLPGIDQIGLPGVDQIGLPGIDSEGERRLNEALRQLRDQSAFRVIGVADAQRTATGCGVTVAILDTGVDQRHPVFLWMWASAQTASGHHGGWAGLQHDLVGRRPSPADLAHGTFVAGLVAGVAPGATLLSVRVADGNGEAPAFRVAAGIALAVAQGAQIINLSMSTPYETPRVLQQAVQRATAAGVLVVGSAGNEGVAEAGYPARFGFGVGATTHRDQRAAFSNYGEGVALGAPGESVYSLYVLPDGRAATATWSGTSFSAALTSGAAALVVERQGAAQQVGALLQRTAKSLGAPVGLGAGRLDVARAVSRA